MLAVGVLVAVAALASASAEVGDQPDPAVISRIREEGLRRSQLMDTLSYLTDVYGSRLTNSPGLRAASDWAIERLKGWQLAGVRKEAWGPFGRGWSNERFVAHVTEPTPWPILGFPKAWTPGTSGVVTAEAILAVIDREEEFPQWAGKLSGKIVLASRTRRVTPLFKATGRRFTASDLDEMAKRMPLSGGPARAYGSSGEFTRQLMRFFAREGVVAVLAPGAGVSDHGSVLVTGNADNRRPDAMPTVPQVVVATEHYGRIVRTLERGVPVRVELDVQSRFHDESLDSFNILAEIPGTDRADEVVMLGAHFDSWHAGTGATDNAAGVAATMEAMRILKATGLTMRRTVRLALWTGEEQGLLGSQAYVAQQFATRATGELKPAHAQLSAYFNLDHGTGEIRGLYLENNEHVRPIFEEWMKPFAETGMRTLTIRGTGSTDHVPFDRVGLPGFQFIQDPIEYFTHSHHSSMDLYERAQAEDLMKNAVIVAAFVYQAATRDALLPRKALPAPLDDAGHGRPRDGRGARRRGTGLQQGRWVALGTSARECEAPAGPERHHEG